MHTAIAAAALATLTAAAAEPGYFEPNAQSIIDIKADPGCGVKNLTAQQKIERNRKLAQLFFQSYVEAPTLQRLYGWQYHRCWADTIRMRAATFTPDQIKTETQMGANDAATDLGLTELRNIWKVMPDWKAIPGSLHITAYENGATFSLRYGGHTADGKFHDAWELDIFEINDSGKINYYEFWSAPPQKIEKFAELVYGRNSESLGAQGYGEVIKEIDRKNKKKN
jgi:hypothetical protein